MTNKGAKFVPGTVDQWLDCGNKKVTVMTNQAVLDMKANKEQLVDPSATIEDSIVIAPCYIGPNVTIKNSVVGPHVSIGENSNVTHSIVKNSIIQTHTQLHNCNFNDSMIGNHVKVNQSPNNSSIGDYTEIS
jgi:glucose-1-phosphate thymidylyltransferase